MENELIKILKEIKQILLLRTQNEKLHHMELIKEIRGIKSQH